MLRYAKSYEFVLYHIVLCYIVVIIRCAPVDRREVAQAALGDEEYDAVG